MQFFFVSAEEPFYLIRSFGFSESLPYPVMILFLVPEKEAMLICFLLI
jgi:hypothetical protein